MVVEDARLMAAGKQEQKGGLELRSSFKGALPVIQFPSLSLKRFITS